jgi:ketosteroid isomerase-like protein
MKRCPTCRRTYADDTLKFCLEDGTPLSADAPLNSDATLLLDSASRGTEPPPTEILDFGPAPTLRALDEDATTQPRKAAATAMQQARPTINESQNPVSPAPVPRNTTSVVAVTAVATILVLAVGGLGAWLLLRDKSGNGNSGTSTTTETARVSNTSNIATTNNGPGSTGSNKNTLPGTVSTPIPVTTPSATPSATPQPTTAAADMSSARREVMDALNGWTETMKQGDLDRHMAYYADTLHTYYMQSNYSASRVRANVAKAFSKYDTFDVKLTNMQIEIDPSGTSAIATFDKTFTFSGATTYSGSGLNRFWLEKIGGRWRITGEKDLKTYYVNND